MLLIIDNYDSFTYNIYHYARDLGMETEVIRNDKITMEELAAAISAGKYSHIILSPGPSRPEDSGICLDVIREFSGKIPILGICLGHQAIGMVFGGNVVKTEPFHGKIGTIKHSADESLFRGIPETFKATRYHSLIIEAASFPESELAIIAKTEAKTDDDAIIMAVRHRKFPVWGVQFHPESIASEYGHKILENFFNQANTQTI